MMHVAGVESSQSDQTVCRIALFVPTLHGGGAERVMVALANEWGHSGVSVDLVLQSAAGPYLKDVHPQVRVVDLRARRLIASILPLAKYIRRARPEVVLATPSSANIVGLLACKLARVSVRTVVREAITPTPDDAVSSGIRAAVIARLRKYVYRHAFRIVAPSSGAADDLAVSIGIPRSSIAVIPNPLDTVRIRKLASEAVDEEALLARSSLVLAAGRLDAQKDFSTLIRAFARVKSNGSILVVLGEGPERTALSNLAADLGLSGRVVMPGFKENPYAYMRRAAVFVLSSRYEGMPNALLEAAFVGTHLVATDCPSGPREILENGRWGRLVRVGDVDELANAIDEALLGRLEKPPVPLIEQRYSVRKIARRYLSLLVTGTDLPDGDAELSDRG